MSSKRKVKTQVPLRGAGKQELPSPLKSKTKAKPAAATKKKAPAAAPKVKKARTETALAPAFGDEDEIKIPELDSGEEDLPVVGAEDSDKQQKGTTADVEAAADEIPDPFASDDEEAEEETKLGKRQRQTLQEEKAAELRKLKSKETARRKAASQAKSSGDSKGSAVIYVGHIPYGFFEEQMRAYFTQFGEVLNIRLSRNKKTGKPKHYAFIEFENAEVARIVAETMNGYFLYRKTLVVKVVPPEKLHPATFVGANRKWRTVPWRKIAQKEHNKARTPAEAEKRQSRLVSKEDAKRKKLAELGIDYEFTGYKAQQVPKAKRIVYED